MIIMTEEMNPGAYVGKVVVLDASVIVDFALESEPRHIDAVRLIKLLIEQQFRARIPYQAVFEFQSAVRNSVWHKSGRHAAHSDRSNQDLTLQLFAVPIDSSFMDRYFTSDLPYLKAGDILYLAMAKADKALLITEDEKLYNRAKEFGVDVSNICNYYQDSMQGQTST